MARLAATDTGRGSSRLVEPVLDDLGAAANTLLAGTAGVIGIITGFYIPRARPPAAETDGPLGAALLADTLIRLGWAVDVVTDDRCLPVVRAGLEAVGQDGARARAWSGREAPDWTHALSVERVGRTSDGTYRNMLGADITDATAPLDVLFEAVGGPRIAVGDGGNEIGMGRLDPGLVAATVESGARIRSVVDCDHLIVAGTSNWGAYALAALLTAETGLDPRALSEQTSRQALDGLVAAGAVDGVSAVSEPTVDGLAWDEYWRVPGQVLALLF